MYPKSKGNEESDSEEARTFPVILPGKDPPRSESLHLFFHCFINGFFISMGDTGTEFWWITRDTNMGLPS